MGLLGKLLGNPTYRLESPDDDPMAKRLRLAQQKNDWKTVQQFFQGLTDPGEREFFVGQLTEWKERLPFFDAWVESSPECAEAWLVRGAHAIQWAWEARTGARAEDVAENAWPIFIQRLEQAWSDLNHAIELNPADATPFGHLIPCAMGLQLEKEIVFSCLQNTIDRSVISWKAHSATLWYLCKKWFGSHEEMFDFARTVSASAPEGNGLHALIPIAHHERWVYAAAFDEDEQLRQNYYHQPEVKEEILDSYNRSLGSRAHQADRATRAQSSFFALALFRIHAFRQSLTELDRLGSVVPEFPWVQLGDPVEKFTQAKEIARESQK
ncbi:MAG: DUF4034 domain-containing protein [Chloroflexi bacterium]|nr:MAG: DUF4034 domain-containing protein [Chloroflexota bacterium]RPI95880.1 MAG: DUF4034 domain-containing protein [Chloroflexota bacterium]